MNVRKLLRSRRTGLFLRFALVLVLAFSVFHVADRRVTLQSAGCVGYWSEFGGVDSFESYEFFSRMERRDLLNGSEVQPYLNQSGTG